MESNIKDKSYTHEELLFILINSARHSPTSFIYEEERDEESS